MHRRSADEKGPTQRPTPQFHSSKDAKSFCCKLDIADFDESVNSNDGGCYV